MEIKVQVKTKKDKQEIIKKNDIYSVNLKSSPINNEANKELIKLFKKKLRLNVRIKKGLTNKNKVLEVVQPKDI